jgi:hypothetical protein
MLRPTGWTSTSHRLSLRHPPNASGDGMTRHGDQTDQADTLLARDGAA